MATTTKTIAGGYGSTYEVTFKDGEAHLTIPANLIADVVNTYSRYAGSRTPGEQAHALCALFDEMNDLATWHPRYSYETGEIDSREIVEDENDG